MVNSLLCRESYLPRLPEISQASGLKAQLLRDSIPELNLAATTRYLSSLSPDESIKLKSGSFGSLAFDIVFSPGILPKRKEPEYKKAYTNFFREQYGVEVFDQSDYFIHQKEEDYYMDDSKAGPNEDLFLQEWVANLRALAILLRRYRPMTNVNALIGNNLIESALCRMAENGEHWPENLIYALPCSMQERLDTIRTEVDREISDGRVLEPGQFFQMANELEFKEEMFLRSSINDRANMVIKEILGLQNRLRPEPDLSLRFNRSIDWQKPTDRQFRQINLSSILTNLEQAQQWTDLLLATSKVPGRLPGESRTCL